MSSTSQQRIAHPMGRSRITNGRALMPRSIDGRSIYMRRFRDVFALLVSDAGGKDRVTEAIKSMARRAATITVELERYECLFADSEDGASPHQLETYQRLTNTLRRLLEAIGLQRQAKDVTPNLQQYLTMKQRDRNRVLIEHEDD